MSARSLEWRKACGRVHKRAAELGLDDDARRDIQRRATGKESCAEMTTAELGRVLDAMNGDAERRVGDRLPQGPLTGKLRALWISGYHLGVVRDRTDDGLAAWLRRQAAVERAAWVSPAAAGRAVEALRSWLARDGGVDWRPYIELRRDGREREIVRPKARVLEAQWRILHRAGAVKVGDLAALGAYACRYARLGRIDSHLALDEAQTVALTKHLGGRVRVARNARGIDSPPRAEAEAEPAP